MAKVPNYTGRLMTQRNGSESGINPMRHLNATYCSWLTTSTMVNDFYAYEQEREFKDTSSSIDLLYE